MSRYRIVKSNFGLFDGREFQHQYIIQLRIRIMWFFTYWTNVTKVVNVKDVDYKLRYKIHSYDSIEEAEKEIERLKNK